MPIFLKSPTRFLIDSTNVSPYALTAESMSAYRIEYFSHIDFFVFTEIGNNLVLKVEDASL